MNPERAGPTTKKGSRGIQDHHATGPGPTMRRDLEGPKTPTQQDPKGPKTPTQLDPEESKTPTQLDPGSPSNRIQRDPSPPPSWTQAPHQEIQRDPRPPPNWIQATMPRDQEGSKTPTQLDLGPPRNGIQVYHAKGPRPTTRGIQWAPTPPTRTKSGPTPPRGGSAPSALPQPPTSLVNMAQK